MRYCFKNCKNVLRLAELLHLDLSSCMKLCAGNPQFFYMNPETIYDKANELAKIKQVDMKFIIEWAIKQPSILLYSTSLVKQKMEINNFYSKVLNEPLKGRTLSMNKDEDLYAKILKFLIKKANKTTVSSSNLITCNKKDSPIRESSSTNNLILFSSMFCSTAKSLTTFQPYNVSSQSIALPFASEIVAV